LLTEAKLERRFRSARSDLTRLYAGYYIAELLDELTDARDPHPELFDEADRALWQLDRGADAAVVVLRFEMAALRELGHLPLLSQCASCGGSVVAAERQAFGHLAGGLLCKGCRGGQRQVTVVRGETIETLRRFADEEQPAARPSAIPPHVRGELRGLVNQYIANLLGHRPKMHSYLGELTR
jgi:DNA repair protein RecO (recombination protein O)